MACYLPRRLGVVVVNSLVAFMSTLDVLPDRYHKLVFLSRSIEPIFMEGVTCGQPIEPLYGRHHMYFTKSFNVVIFNLYSSFFAPERDLCALYCAHRIELIIQKSSHQIALCLNRPTKSDSGSD